MRKILIFVLLAGAAASPALADQDRDTERRPVWSDRQQSHEQRQQVRDQARTEQPIGTEPSAAQARTERPVPQIQVGQPVGGGDRGGFDGSHFERGNNGSRVVEAPHVQDGERAGFDRSRFERRNSGPRVVEAPQMQGGERGSFDRSGSERGDGGPRVVEVPQQGPDANRGNWRRDRGDNSSRSGPERSGAASGWTRTQNGWTRGGDLRHSDRPVPNVMRSPSPLIVSDSPREGTQPALRADARRRSINWTTNWRNDHRYDWRNWRDRHRSTFHVGVYYDPFGWSYRPYQIGWRLWPSYYGRRYWIDDPYQYRLPYAPPGTVWVRYWDDALLIDTWTGEVVDVIHNFFW